MSLRKGNTIISGAGKDGADGADGISPSASVSKSGSVSTLTVTDARGTTTTDILDGGQVIQYVTMPTASADNLGDILQYIGASDETYTNGYFYKCVSDGEQTPTYSWQQANVQESGAFVRRSNCSITFNTKTPPEFDEDAQWIMDTYLNSSNQNVAPSYMVGNYTLNKVEYYSGSSTYDYKLYFLRFYATTLETNIGSFTINVYTHYNNNKIYDSSHATYYPKASYLSNTSLLSTSTAATSYLSKTNTNIYTPTEMYHPATKVYVDSSVGEIDELAVKQFSTMPSASDQNKIVLAKYIGADTADYKFGKTYCLKDDDYAYKMIINSASKFLLGYEVQNTDTIKVKFANRATTGSDEGIYGNTENNENYHEVHFYNTNMYVGTGRSQMTYTTQPTYDNNLCELLVNVNGTAAGVGDIVLNGRVLSQNVTFGTGGTLQLFEYKNKRMLGEFYYLEIIEKQTGTRKKKWVPALHDGQVCIHELVSDTYIYNSYSNTPANELERIISENAYWVECKQELEPDVITNSDSTYTITNLEEHQLYNLGEITSLDITAVDTIYLESKIYLTSGSTPTVISLPDDIVNIGDIPTFTSSGGVNSATLDSNKSYIINVLNGIAEWKKY